MSGVPKHLGLRWSVVCRRGLAWRAGIEVALLRAVAGAAGFRLKEDVLPAGETWPSLMKRLNQGDGTCRTCGTCCLMNLWNALLE